MKRLLKILFLMSAFSGCIEQMEEIRELPGETAQGKDSFTELSVRVSDIANTRSSVTADETRIADLNFFAYRNGVAEAETYSTKLSQIIVKLTYGYSYNLYAIANMGRVAAPAKEEDLLSYRHDINSIEDLSEILPMVWTQQGFMASQTSMSLGVRLDRLVSKVIFSVDKSALEGLEVTSIRLCQSAGTVYPFAVSGSAIGSGTETITGDYASASDLETVNSGGSIYFYTLENCQGTLLSENRDPWKKSRTPWESEPVYVPI